MAKSADEPQQGGGENSQSVLEGKKVEGDTMQMAPQSHRSLPERDLQSGISRELQVQIGQDLRVIYDEIIQGPVPGRLQRLLSNLGQTSAKRSS